jgi:glutamate synthase domain-containing protein 2/glutamate synthase domain-containing protein 1/glutamate synthase domain-containing protein 3
MRIGLLYSRAFHVNNTSTNSNPPRPGPPPAQGLYCPGQEHDSCGVGFLCHLKGAASHGIVSDALQMCRNMDHRGGCGCDPDTGDGAGIMMQVPHRFFQGVAAERGFELPGAGAYGVAFVYMSPEPAHAEAAMRLVERVVRDEGQRVLGWRDVPVVSRILGKASRANEPAMKQLFIGRDPALVGDAAFDRKLYLIRRVATDLVRYRDVPGSDHFYVASLSARTVIYKGMLTTGQLCEYFPDLHDPAMETAMALVHSRFSTNTFPSWPRAQPFRTMCHNGEINTMRGNANWMAARQCLFSGGPLGPDIERLLPIIRSDGSDSAMFDNCLEFLVLSGRSLPHAVMMMIPEPWENHRHMPPEKTAFYEYHACLMEPWDGPASIAFCDGVSIGAVLDRNGLRPSRFYVTSDDLVIMASEVGVLPVEPARVIRKGRLEPGRMFLVDTAKGRIVDDAEVKGEIAAARPYARWLEEGRVFFNNLPPVDPPPPVPGTELLRQQRAFGYTFEDKRFILGPTAETASQPLGSMGNDAPLAVLSDRPQLLYNYFKQLFAQVTNPAIDPIREELITASVTFLGPEGDMIDPGPKNCRLLRIETPIIDNASLARLRDIEACNLAGFRSATLPILYPARAAEAGLAAGQLPGHMDNPDLSIEDPASAKHSGHQLEVAMDRLCNAADLAIRQGVNLLILSDRGVNARRAPIPALLAVAGLHHHLIREGTRTKVSIILESGEPREVHHFSLLLGYGADAINPWLALDALAEMSHTGETGLTPADAAKRYLKASIKGVIKTMAKMGISTVASYRGAQIFEAVGLSHKVIDKYFTWTASRVEGIGLEGIDREVKIRHDDAFAEREHDDGALEPGGVYQWRKDGERHLFNPQTIHLLQQATRLGSYEVFQKYAKLVDDQSREFYTLRGLMEFRTRGVRPIPLGEVEPVESIVRRFKTGAMSYGSISKEVHETLAIAMNRLGGWSNTGEGGEDPVRYTWTNERGDSKNSAIKQVASGRFGVTSYYMVNARELQIKISQGAKPGEGGELPGHKVLPAIAKVRGTTPGVGLISPPPHHDIYSIEDLAELIHDLKNGNRRARINVKLVSEIGVGTIAAGVAKAKADVILISGHDGGTGASPRSSIQHAGCPWELGLAETNQTLLLNDLRSRVVLETDGQLKTGRDVAIACLLGAEEFGFATAPLVALGCLMMRVCHKNTCPVGIATQDERLRANYTGAADHVVHFMRFVADQLREIMAQLGFRTVDEMVGRTDLLEMRPAIDHWKARGLDYSKILYRPKVDPEVGTFCQREQDHLLERSLDITRILPLCQPAIERGENVHAELPIVNVNRVVGTITGSEISRRHGAEGLPDGTVHLKFRGTAGQSFAAFCPRGMTLELEGDANDYLGKGLCGARVILYPPQDAAPGFVPEENIILGNVAFYGATGGEAFLCGLAGERFCVRNSGVHAVVEGLGDHACEYMTGGSVVCLGRTGRNFAAGMSGGVAYVLDEDGVFAGCLNTEMVRLLPLSECGEEEILEVHARIQLHEKLTRSPKAARLLGDWDRALGLFHKVLPTDYERVLLALRDAEAGGLQGDEAIQAAFEANAKVGH